MSPENPFILVSTRCFSNLICDIWNAQKNALPGVVVEAFSSNILKQLLNYVNVLVKYCFGFRTCCVFFMQVCILLCILCMHSSLC